MNRRATKFWASFLSITLLLTGCHPTQPFYFHEDGDMAHYIDAATDIEVPDVSDAPFAEAAGSKRPLSLTNPHFDEIVDISLQEAICTALQNSKVLRSLGGVTLGMSAPRQLMTSPRSIPTVYDPALSESSPGSVGRGSGVQVAGQGRGVIPGAPGIVAAEHPAGVEAALSAFDARLSAGMVWERVDSPQNSSGVGGIGMLFPSVSTGNRSNFHVQLSKRAATGSEFFIRTNGIYTDGNAPYRAQPSDWLANVEMEMRQPLLRGAGTQVNRMNVVLARIRTDVSLADFEAGVRNMVSDVEVAYWDLYFQYRNLEARKVARDSALVTWRHANAGKGRTVPAADEAQARQQYFRLRSQVEQSLRDLFKVENRLRYIMGLAATDGRLFRPSDEPTTARVPFPWRETLAESLYRSVELRKQRWQIKRREMELIVARNGLLPTLDAVAMYRWLGRGDDLIEGSRKGLNMPARGSLAWDELTEGRYQEWQLGFQFEMPLGFRKELAGVRYFQLALAREKARLDDMELEVSHSLTDAIQNLDATYALAQTNFNWWVAAQKEVDAVEAAYKERTITLDVLLNAQQRRADAETAYYQTLVSYNKAIAQVHFRKGSLLEYDGVGLAEGPWAQKAYFDAMAYARRRGASQYMDYGYTRPQVISRGPHAQQTTGIMGNVFTQPDGSVIVDPSQLKVKGQGTPTLAPIPATQPNAAPTPAPFQPQPKANQPQGQPALQPAGQPQNLRQPLLPLQPQASTRSQAKHPSVMIAAIQAVAPPTNKTAQPNSVQPGKVQVVAYQQVVTQRDEQHETIANPTPAKTPRAASGWKRAQH